jgi:hypothetical protein
MDGVHTCNTCYPQYMQYECNTCNAIQPHAIHTCYAHAQCNSVKRSHMHVHARTYAIYGAYVRTRVMRTYVRTYVHAAVRTTTYVHARYVQPSCMRTYIHACMQHMQRMRIHTYIHTYIHTVARICGNPVIYIHIVSMDINIIVHGLTGGRPRHCCSSRTCERGRCERKH